MEVELFTAYLGEKGEIRIEINEDILLTYRKNVEDVSKIVDTENIYKTIKEFVIALTI